MRLSAPEEYGLRCLMQVARAHPDGRPAPIASVAEAEGLSHEYAAKLLRVLRQGGLLDSVRGAGGGYRLSRDPSQISVWQVLSVLDGPMFTRRFCASHTGTASRCVHAQDCSVRALWTRIADALESVLTAISLDDMLVSECTLNAMLDVSYPTGLLCEPAHVEGIS